MLFYILMLLAVVAQTLRPHCLYLEIRTLLPAVLRWPVTFNRTKGVDK